MPGSLAIEPKPAATSGTWALRFGFACLAVALLPFVWDGVRGWREDDRIRAVVIDFFHAVADGRHDAAQRFLSADLRQRFAPSSPAADIAGDVQILILSVQADADRAIVKASIGKQGFALRPIVRLQRENGSAWTITAIDGLEIDPHWTTMQHREVDGHLAEELTEKLQTDE